MTADLERLRARLVDWDGRAPLSELAEELEAFIQAGTRVGPEDTTTGAADLIRLTAAGASLLAKLAVRSHGGQDDGPSTRRIADGLAALARWTAREVRGRPKHPASHR